MLCCPTSHLLSLQAGAVGLILLHGFDSGATAQRAGKIDKDWNILYHLGGNGPWIQKVDDVVTNDIAPPEGCTVQQVHMISRHGERYPTISSGQRMVDLVTRLRASGTEIKGDLSFLNNWNFFLNSTDSAQMFEQLTPTGALCWNSWGLHNWRQT